MRSLLSALLSMVHFVLCLTHAFAIQPPREELNKVCRLLVFTEMSVRTCPHVFFSSFHQSTVDRIREKLSKKKKDDHEEREAALRELRLEREQLRCFTNNDKTPTTHLAVAFLCMMTTNDEVVGHRRF